VTVGTIRCHLQPGVIIIDNVKMSRESLIVTIKEKDSNSKKEPAKLTDNILF
jgi:hypothetical protein